MFYAIWVLKFIVNKSFFKRKVAICVFQLCACERLLHSVMSLIYESVRLTAAVVYPIYLSFKAVRNKNVREYVGIFMHVVTIAKLARRVHVY